MNKKGRGLVQGIVIGVAALVISVIIAFIIVSNVATVDDDIAAAVTVKVTNETSTWVNSTGYTLATATKEGFASPTILLITNVTGGTQIASTNASVTSAGVVTNATTYEWNNTYLTYTYTWTPTENTGDLMISNFTSGVDNVSSKIPTIMLIAAVVLILGILILLWNQYQRMGLGGGSEL